MNLSAPDAPPPGAPSEGAVVRFLAWLINPPVESLSPPLRVLRWLLRMTVFLVWCAIVGGDGNASGMGGESVGRKNPKPGKPPV